MSSSSPGFFISVKREKETLFQIERTFQRAPSRTSCSWMYSWPSLSKSARVFAEEAPFCLGTKGRPGSFSRFINWDKNRGISHAVSREQKQKMWGESKRLIIRSEGDQLIIPSSRRHERRVKKMADDLRPISFSRDENKNSWEMKQAQTFQRDFSPRISHGQQSLFLPWARYNLRVFRIFPMSLALLFRPNNWW